MIDTNKCAHGHKQTRIIVKCYNMCGSHHEIEGRSGAG